jgi:hypothetical protein
MSEESITPDKFEKKIEDKLIKISSFVGQHLLKRLSQKKLNEYLDVQLRSPEEIVIKDEKTVYACQFLKYDTATIFKKLFPDKKFEMPQSYKMVRKKIFGFMEAVSKSALLKGTKKVLFPFNGKVALNKYKFWNELDEKTGKGTLYIYYNDKIKFDASETKDEDNSDPDVEAVRKEEQKKKVKI